MCNEMSNAAFHFIGANIGNRFVQSYYIKMLAFSWTAYEEKLLIHTVNVLVIGVTVIVWGCCHSGGPKGLEKMNKPPLSLERKLVKETRLQLQQVNNVSLLFLTPC